MGDLEIRLQLGQLRLRPEDTEVMEREIVEWFKEWHGERARLPDEAVIVRESREFRAESQVLATTEVGPIIEVRVEGRDDYLRGNKICAALQHEIDEQSSAGVVLDYKACKEMYDSDIGGIVAGLHREDLGTCCPCAIVAKGRAGRAAADMLRLMSLPDVVKIQVFQDQAAGLAFIEQVIAQ